MYPVTIRVSRIENLNAYRIIDCARGQNNAEKCVNKKKKKKPYSFIFIAASISSMPIECIHSCKFSFLLLHSLYNCRQNSTSIIFTYLTKKNFLPYINSNRWTGRFESFWIYILLLLLFFFLLLLNFFITHT